MNQLKQINSSDLPESPSDIVKSSAMEALKSAGLNGVDLMQMQARDLVGRYIAGVSVGNIQAELALHKEAVERSSLSASFILGRIIRTVNSDELAEVDVESVTALMEQINRCAQTFATLAAIQLKTAETYGKSDRKEKEKSNAPQLIATNMQVNINEAQKPLPKLDDDDGSSDSSGGE